MFTPLRVSIVAIALGIIVVFGITGILLRKGTPRID